jgi:hypothetical protein
MPALAPMTPSSTIAITVAAATANVALPTPAADQVMITSPSGNAIAFINFGIAGVTVVIPTGTKQSAIPILPGTAQTFTVTPPFTNIATIGTAGNTLYITCGDGF